MSRTDRDRPYWVQVRDPLVRTNEYHDHVYSRARNRAPGCDYEQWWQASGSRLSWRFNCGAWLAGRSRYRSTNVPKWYVDCTWNNPERVRVRSRLREIAKEWNASGDAEDFPNFQHRHRSRWSWD